MLKRFFLMLIIFNSMLLLTSCWSSKEISELLIVTGMGIDKDSESGEYVVTLQVINPGEIASQTKTERLEVTDYQTKGKTVYEVMRRISTEVPRKMYLSHIQLVIFGEELAKEGIAKTLDYISRNHEFRTDFYILVSKNGRAEEILNALTPTEASPSVSMYSSIQVSEKIWAPTKGVQLDELLSTLDKDGKNPVLTGVIVRGDENKGDEVSGLEQIKPAVVTKIIGFAGFKKDKLVGWLNEKESKGYNYIINNIKSTVAAVKCEDGGYFSIEVTKAKAKMKSKMKNNQPSMTIELEIDANLGEMQCNMDLTKPETIKKIEAMAKHQVKANMEDSVSKAKEDLHSDIFGFGEAFHRQHPKEWKKLKDNWEETFQSLVVNYKINYKINRVGTITDSFQKDTK